MIFVHRTRNIEGRLDRVVFPMRICRVFRHIARELAQSIDVAGERIEIALCGIPLADQFGVAASGSARKPCGNLGCSILIARCRLRAAAPQIDEMLGVAASLDSSLLKLRRRVAIVWPTVVPVSVPGATAMGVNSPPTTGAAIGGGARPGPEAGRLPVWLAGREHPGLPAGWLARQSQAVLRPAPAPVVARHCHSPAERLGPGHRTTPHRFSRSPKGSPSMQQPAGSAQESAALPPLCVSCRISARRAGCAACAPLGSARAHPALRTGIGAVLTTWCHGNKGAPKR